ncbi:MAG: tetratricopeptide repeat protein [Desulfuromonadales bacterium]|nr:tetratricopeptide repeat protein [Desulfuromonadales bacterium]
MSSKKDKLIEEAQKLAIKGPVDKAVKAYEQLVAMEPAALNHRQRLADLLLKAGRLDDARREYEVIGKNFSTNGFYLKAIAIYTKLQGLFPGDIPIILILAGLNEKHGLTANALAEYKRVYDFYENNSETDEALKILEVMQNVDPQNINIRLKLAEAYFKAGKPDESYAVFGKLATLLQERGDAPAFAKLNARIQQLFPKKPEFMLEVISEQVASGNAANAVTGLQALLRTNPNDRRLWELILEAYKQLDQPQKVIVAYQHFLKFFPGELSAKAGLALCLASERDLKGALNLLDIYEQELFSAGYLSELEHIYQILDEIDPINLRVLEALSRVYAALGRKEELSALDTKIQSLQKMSGAKAHSTSQTGRKSPVKPVYSAGKAAEEPEFGEISFAHILEKTDTEVSPREEDARTVLGMYENPEEELEIEVEIEEEPVLDILLDDSVTDSEADNVLDVAGKMLDSIATKAGKVKFANSLDGSDAQSHYDLGQAFMEMGLYDESFNEFRQASVDTDRRFACIVFQAICLREKGDLVNAEKVLRTLLNPGFSADDLYTVKYELALTCEVCGKNEDYVTLLTEIDVLNRNFRDVHSRLAAINHDKDFLDFTDDDLKGLDFK